MTNDFSPDTWLAPLETAIDALIEQHQQLRKALTNQPPAAFDALEAHFQAISEHNDQFADAEQKRLTWVLDHEIDHSDPDAIIQQLTEQDPSGTHGYSQQWQAIAEKARHYQTLASANQQLLERLEQTARARIEFLIAPQGHDSELYTASGSQSSTDDRRRHLGGA